jgi:DNA replication protein DnaC
VRFTTAAALVHELIEARDEKRLLRFQKNLARQELLIVDELGFVPLSKTGAEMLFEVFSQRYERTSTLVTSNLPFAEWTEVLGSERAHRRAAGSAHSPRSHPGDERGQLPAQAQ